MEAAPGGVMVEAMAVAMAAATVGVMVAATAVATEAAMAVEEMVVG